MEEFEKDIEVAGSEEAEATIEKDKKPEKGSKKKAVLREVLSYLIILVIAILIRLVFLINATIPTGSMNDTIPTDTRVLGLKCSYWFNGVPERGDIIVFDAPDEPGVLYVKRVIGLPGETVELRTVPYLDGAGNDTGETTTAVYIDGELLDEPYIKDEIWTGWSGTGVFEVPEDSVFCMGDNRNNSLDARYWTNTYVSYDKIEGKAYCIYWPLSEISWLY